MKKCQRWLVWREEKGSRTKPTKVPYYANGSRRSGTLDSPSDVQQLSTYQECLLILKAGGFSGLAFALGPDGNGGYWQGVDLDNVSQNHLPDLVYKAPGYVEVSPSGNGAHAIGFGRVFDTLGSNGSGVEAYSGKRFFTFTGQLIKDSGLTCLADYVEQFAAPIHGAGHSRNYAKHRYTPPSATVTIDPRIVTELRSALASMRSDDYKLWTDMGLALAELGNIGRGLWFDWSSSSQKFNPTEASRKWDTFKPNSISYKTVFHTAQKYGWVNPKSNKAQIQSTEPANNITIDIAEPSIVNIEYLDDPYIPKGQAIGFYGRGESGKSSLAATLTARNSISHSTLWITSEESPDHIKTRHKCIGNQDNTIAVVNQSGFDVYTHLEEMITQAKAKLSRPLGFVVLDAVVALVTWGSRESPNDDGAVKRLIGFIERISQSEGVSILMLGHLNKGKGHDHIADAVLGATAWTSSVRLAYMLQKVPDEDYVGFIRTAKTNVNTHFGAFYRTTPVFQMAANIDGFRPSLCKVEFTSERIYGERALILAMAEDDDMKSNKIEEREKKIQVAITAALRVLSDGATKTREDIEATLGKLKLNRRNWLKMDEGLIAQNVQITNGKHNKKHYQLCTIPPPL